MRLLCNLEDGELLRLLKDDQESALASIYQKYWDKLYFSAGRSWLLSSKGALI